jgi:formylglycine-generating enzyme required for sulfatase activity
MGTTEITQLQWNAVMRENPSYHRGDRFPVDSVTWTQAQEFCASVSRTTARRARLPKEAEWEYACLAGTRGPYSFGANNDKIGQYGKYEGSTLDDYGWYAANTGANPTSAAVGQKAGNALGLRDMHGNVEEWCEEVFPGGFQTQRALRGGAFKLKASDCQCMSRRGQIEGTPDPLIGFRIIVEIP